METPSPPDLSPNEPLVGHDDPQFFVQEKHDLGDNNATASTEGSIDSSGYEKVEHDVLEEYRNTFDRQMQQSVYGGLPDDPDDEDELEPDTGFLLVGRKSIRFAERPKDPDDVQLLQRDPEIAGAENMSASKSDVVEKDYGAFTGDLIDIPRNDSPPVERAPSLHEPEPHHENAPDVPSEASPAQHVEDLLDFDNQAKTLVEDAVREAQKSHAHEEHHPEPPAAFERIEEPEPLHEEIPTVPDIPVVENVHDEVDDIVERMQENDEFQEMVSGDRKSPIDNKSDLDRPDFRQTPEPEETLFDRRGPLTIPEVPEVPAVQAVEDFDFPPPTHHHHGFETEPRPPTPPRAISEEDVKPSLVNLGSSHPQHSHERHSILKHSSSGEPWVTFKTVDPRILDIIYWRDVKRSAIALALTLLVIFILAKYPLLSVLAYSGLALLGATIGFRIFKSIEAQIKKTGGENPFQEYLNKELNLPQERVHAQVDVLAEHGTCLANQAKKLIFVENIVDSVKFGLLLWALTYVSSWFSGFALIILTVLGVFSVPKIYETYQEPIDAHLGVISDNVNNVLHLLEEKLPFLKRAQAEAEKKEQ